ncbi:MAG TPA: hypothetical protein VKA85_12645, partial [Candidatus Limnocylindrales bacterium]|nr:hypothetical protein [Candidatus Limnocylindrales bacterium]
MNRTDPPEWALPAWDDVPAASPGRAAAAPPSTVPPPRPVATPPGTFGLRILAVSEVTKAVKGAVQADERLRDLWVE